MTTVRTVGSHVRRIAALVIAAGVAVGEAPNAGAGESISEDDARSVARAGVLKRHDLDELKDGEGDEGQWRRYTDGYLGQQEEMALCLVLDDNHVATGTFADGVLTARRSRVFEQSDGRGPTLVGVEIRSDTLVYDSEAAAERAFGELDEDFLASCIAGTGAQREAESIAAGDEEEGELFTADDDVEADRLDEPELGDEAVALQAPFDNHTGDGDDNYSSAELYAVRTGQVVEVLYTWRYGEGQDDDVVAVETPTVPETLERLLDRIEDASD